MSVPYALQTDLLFDPFDADWNTLRAAATAAENVGFDGLWTWDHLVGGVHAAGHVLERWTLLTAITRRVTVGPLVLNVANRYPGVMAVMAATLQHISGGRVLLGLGAGGGGRTPYAAEQAALGHSGPGDAVRRWQVVEAVDVLRQVRSGRVQPTPADYFPLGEGAGFLRPRPLPPIVIGAFGPKMAELAGRVGDGINLQAGHPLPERTPRDRSGSPPGQPAGHGVHRHRFCAVQRTLAGRWRPERVRLRSLGVQRLILLAGATPDLARIQNLARKLKATD